MSREAIKDGGPAFPSTQPTETWATGQHGQAVPVMERHGGMSLRDWFAGQSLEGYCAVEAGWDQPPEEVARCCYRIADAMLKAREAQS